MRHCVLQVLEPLQMACTIDVPRIAEPALGCLHKLVRRFPWILHSRSNLMWDLFIYAVAPPVSSCSAQSAICMHV